MCLMENKDINVQGCTLINFIRTNGQINKAFFCLFVCFELFTVNFSQSLYTFSFTLKECALKYKSL